MRSSSNKMRSIGEKCGKVKPRHCQISLSLTHTHTHVIHQTPQTSFTLKFPSKDSVLSFFLFSCLSILLFFCLFLKCTSLSLSVWLVFFVLYTYQCIFLFMLAFICLAIFLNESSKDYIISCFFFAFVSVCVSVLNIIFVCLYLCLKPSFCVFVFFTLFQLSHVLCSSLDSF